MAAGKARIPLRTFFEFFELGANAFVSGLAVAIALSVITLALATGAQAASLNDAKTEAQRLRTDDPLPDEPKACEAIAAKELEDAEAARGKKTRSGALTPLPSSEVTDVSALWARACFDWQPPESSP